MRRFFAPAAAVGLSLALAVPVGAGGVPPTTLDQTIVSEGDRDLALGPGEKRVTRSLDKAPKKGKGRSLAGFKQLSDIHVVDEESPGRVEFFDNCDFGSSAYRPQEAMSLQVGESMIRVLNGFKRGPATGAPLDFTISTGDNIDNNAQNELAWFIDLLNGGTTIDPDSGIDGYEGYSQAHTPDAFSDEILELANDPFDATGVGPWYAVLGNHDALVQGNLPFNTNFQILVQGSSKIFIDPAEYEEKCPASIADAEDAFFDEYFGPNSLDVTSDSRRRFVSHETMVKEFQRSDGKPNGHGLKKVEDDPTLDGPAGYYTFDISDEIVGVVMDTVNYTFGSEGSLSDHQFDWIEKQLKENSRRYYAPNGKRKKNRKGEDKLVVLFSHHTSRTLNNPAVPTEDVPPGLLPVHCFDGSAEGCTEGESFHNLLTRYPNVIAWVNGHEHNNRVTPFRSPKKKDPTRGFWELNTAAHIDWPQQSRLIEIAWKAGKGKKPDSVFIYGTVVDHGAAVDPDADLQDPIEYLASLSRVESYFDACVRESQADCAAGGGPGDRNVKLVQQAPFDLRK